MFAVGGMLLFGASDDLLTMFIALEVLSLPLYLLCGLARRRRLLSQEAALKYFLLGAFSSGVLPLRRRDAVRLRWHPQPRRHRRGDSFRSGKMSLALIGTGLVLWGCCSRSARCRSTPGFDVYQGAPTPITAFMAAATKIAALGRCCVTFYIALPALRDDRRPVLWAVAIPTMVVGTVTAVTQTDVKRMPAYSAVAHPGSSSPADRRERGRAVLDVLFYPFAAEHARRLRRQSGPATRPVTRTPRCHGGPDWAAAIPLSAWCFRRFCWPSRAYR